jgi:hypothetical protein
VGFARPVGKQPKGFVRGCKYYTISSLLNKTFRSSSNNVRFPIDETFQ